MKSAIAARPWAVFLAFSLGLWMLLPLTILPSPLEILGAFPDLLFQGGLAQELFTSLSLNIQATAVMIVVSLAVSYSTKFPGIYGEMLRPLSAAVSAGRFNSFVGLPFLLTLLIGDAHTIKVILLATAMTVFAVPSIVDILNNIPREKFDDARVLRMNEWQVLWEVVILGRIDEVLDVIRTQWAMAWMILPMVEGLFRSERGIGILILEENKYLKLDAVYCLVVVVCLAGWCGDKLIDQFKRMACPYAFLGE